MTSTEVVIGISVVVIIILIIIIFVLIMKNSTSAPVQSNPAPNNPEPSNPVYTPPVYTPPVYTPPVPVAPVNYNLSSYTIGNVKLSCVGNPEALTVDTSGKAVPSGVCWTTLSNAPKVCNTLPSCAGYSVNPAWNSGAIAQLVTYPFSSNTGWTTYVKP